MPLAFCLLFCSMLKENLTDHLSLPLLLQADSLHEIADTVHTLCFGILDTGQLYSFVWASVCLLKFPRCIIPVFFF